MLKELTESFYHTFVPREDDKQNYDEQKGFVESNTRGVAFHIGGNAAGTTEAAVYKLCEFVLHQQPPPRKATPFWIIGPTFEKVTKSIWTEKMEGHNHLPSHEYDKNKIVWDIAKANKPREVHLKPWPIERGGHPDKWWVLVFKSTDQSIQQFSAESVGGFLFSEQFPWEYLIETVRGCRDYNFPGSKMCEFTPINPVLSIELEEMEENDELPPGWEIYRANTEANVKDPMSVVDEQWFGEFFSVVSSEMAATRQIGAFASYKGRIYQSFNRSVHLVTGIEIPRGVYHCRGIDWGQSEENALAVIWAFRDTLGCWYVYDEYYSTSQDCGWYEHARAIHEKDGWELSHHGDEFVLTPLLRDIQNGELGPRWKYGDNPNFAPTYVPHDQRIAPFEFHKYHIPCAHVDCGPGSVLEGIELIRRLLKPSSGPPQIFIDRVKAPYLAKQIQIYRWQQGTVGRNPKDSRGIPLKKDDHSPDALRYLLRGAYHGSTAGIEAHWEEREMPTSVRMRRLTGVRFNPE